MLNLHLKPFLGNDIGCLFITNFLLNEFSTEENTATTQAVNTSRWGWDGRQYARERHRGGRKMSPGQKVEGSTGESGEGDEKEVEGILQPCQTDVGRAA